MKFSLSVTFLLLFSLGAFAQGSEARLREEFGNVPCDDLIARLDMFLAEVHNEPSSRGVVVLYEGKYWSYEKEKLVRPVFGEVQMRANLIRSHFSFRGFPTDRILFVSGGFRDEHHAELWLVPPGAPLPKPKPSLKSVQYRKGKPTSIIPSCP